MVYVVDLIYKSLNTLKLKHKHSHREPALEIKKEKREEFEEEGGHFSPPMLLPSYSYRVMDVFCFFPNLDPVELLFS